MIVFSLLASRVKQLYSLLIWQVNRQIQTNFHYHTQPECFHRLQNIQSIDQQYYLTSTLYSLRQNLFNYSLFCQLAFLQQIFSHQFQNFICRVANPLPIIYNIVLWLYYHILFYFALYVQLFLRAISLILSFNFFYRSRIYFCILINYPLYYSLQFFKLLFDNLKQFLFDLLWLIFNCFGLHFFLKLIALLYEDINLILISLSSKLSDSMFEVFSLGQSL